MVEAWLVELMTAYNRDSRSQRNGYIRRRRRHHYHHRRLFARQPTPRTRGDLRPGRRPAAPS